MKHDDKNMTIASAIDRKSFAIIAWVSVMVVIDAATLLFPALGYLGMGAHLLSIMLLSLVALHALFTIVRTSIRIKSGFTLLVLGIWIALIGFWAQDSRSLSGETTQETTCAIAHLEDSQDIGLHQTCLFGYPARQYLPQAVASLVFGRSLLAMNLAGSVYFLIGILLFSQAGIVVLGNNRRSDTVTAIILASVFHFRFVNHFLFHFEQSIFPLSFAFMLTGLGLHISNRQRTSFHWGLAGIGVVLATHSYTPSLVLLGLVIPISLGIIWKHRQWEFAGVWLIVVCFTSLIISLTYRHDLSFGTTSERTTNELIKDVAQAHAHILLGNRGEPIISPILHGVVIAFVLSAMLGLHGKRVAFIGWWAYGVFLTSVISKGYSYYAVDFRLHRSLVVIPPLLASGLQLLKLHRQKPDQKTLVSLLAFIVISGVYYSYTQVSRRPINTHYEIIKQLTYFTQAETQSLVVTPLAAQSENLISLHDSAQYFLPSITVRNVTEEEATLDDCARLSDSTNLLLIHSTDNKCLRSLNNGQAFSISSKHLQAKYVIWKPYTRISRS